MKSREHRLFISIFLWHRHAAMNPTQYLWIAARNLVSCTLTTLLPENATAAARILSFSETETEAMKHDLEPRMTSKSRCSTILVVTKYPCQEAPASQASLIIKPTIDVPHDFQHAKVRDRINHIQIFHSVNVTPRFGACHILLVLNKKLIAEGRMLVVYAWIDYPVGGIVQISSNTNPQDLKPNPRK